MKTDEACLVGEYHLCYLQVIVEVKAQRQICGHVTKFTIFVLQILKLFEEDMMSYFVSIL